MSDEPHQAQESCARCGAIGARKLVASRVANLTTSGQVNVFHCEGCGGISHNEVPREAPKE